MNGNTVTTPEGTRDRLFSECRDRRGVQSSITSLFKRRGYNEIITPEVEYYDLFVQSGSPLPQETLVKIIDRSGKILVMRPDCTTPVARVAATKMKNLVFPQRLYYNQTVFRSGAEYIGKDGEIAQCGVELIGAGGLKADIEVISMAVEVLEACGVSNFHIEIGHAGFFNAIVAELGVDADTAELMRSYIETRNFAALNDLLRPYSDKPASAALCRMPQLFGEEETLEEARSLANGGDAGKVIDYLRTVFEELKAAGHEGKVRVDLGFLHRIDYYTGIVFRGYVEGAGSVVLSGGRYDNLIGCIGSPMPATGFAIDVDAVAGCLPHRVIPKLKTLVHYSEGCLRRAYDIVDSSPVGTCELSACETLEESMELARKRGVQKIIVVENGNEYTLSLA